MCMYDGDDPPAFYNATTPTARKAHRCCECRRTIEPGERYESVTAKWDMGVSTYKTCRHCDAAKHWLEVECNGYLFEAVEEDLEQHFDEQPDLHLGRLIIGIRHQWRVRHGARAGGLMDELVGSPATWEAKRAPAMMR